MDPYGDIRRWAERVPLAAPIRWGDVEQQVLAQPMPAPEPWPEHLATPAQLQRRVAVLLVVTRALLALALVAIPGSLVLGAVASTTDGRDAWRIVLGVAIVLAGATIVTSVTVTGDHRPSRWWIVACAGALLSAAVTLALAWPAWLGLPHVGLIALAVGSPVALVLVLVRRRRLPPSPPDRIDAPDDVVRRRARAIALRAIVARGGLDEVDEAAMDAMPLEAWHELDR